MSNFNPRRSVLHWAIALVCLASSPATEAQQVFDSNLSFTTADQSMWDSGEAFIFDYLQFFGIDPAPRATTVNPSVVSGGTPPFSNWTVDPYFLFETDFRLGMEIGAKVNGGSIDANLDYHVALEAPDDIVPGTPFSLTGIATKQGTSGFQSSPANAEAWVDGVVQASFGGYARIVTGGSVFVFGSHDYRMGDDGFTDGSTTNVPYRSLINVNYKPEIIGINRNESGQLHVLGQNQGGTGSEYTFGPTTITAGNWNVSATGALDGDVVQGSDEKTLVTASLDIDQMVTTAAGLPPLGAGVAHDWGAIAFDVGYEILDVRAVLELGLKQDFSITSEVTVHLQFSENVMIDGVGETNSYLGPLNAIPDITLLSNSVSVDPEFIVTAQLNNDTDLTVTERLPIALFEGHVNVAWDVAGVSGNNNNGFGPIYEVTPLSNTNAIDVFSNQFALGGFQTITGDSFTLTATDPSDVDHDGDVDGADFLMIQRTNPALISAWQAAFGSGTGTPASGAVGAVPEPSTIVLSLLSAISLCGRGRKSTTTIAGHSNSLAAG